MWVWPNQLALIYAPSNLKKGNYPNGSLQCSECSTEYGCQQMSSMECWWYGQKCWPPHTRRPVEIGEGDNIFVSIITSPRKCKLSGRLD
jgi:hypothetical protein